jgi:hypothetical protein
MPLRIDKNVPIPPAAKDGKYPFKTMKIGDSFFCPARPDRRQMESLRSSLYNCGKRADVQVTVRKVAGGIRCWRTQ